MQLNVRNLYFHDLYRMLYFTVVNSASIERVSLDGIGRDVLHNTSLGNTFSLTLDIPSQTLFWLDTSLRRVESSNVDGSNRTTLEENTDPGSFAITVDGTGNTLFYTVNPRGPSSIRRLDAAGGTPSTEFATLSLRSALGIEFVDPLKQTLGTYIR